MTKLPKMCRFQDGWLVKLQADGEEIFRCNYLPILISATTVDASEPGNPLVRFVLQIEGEARKDIHEMRLFAFLNCDLERLDIACRSEGDRHLLSRTMYETIRSQITSDDLAESHYFAQTGWATLGGRSVYIAGNRVLDATGWVDSDKYHLAPALAGLTLDVDREISEINAAKYVRRLCRLHRGVSDILMASAVVGHLFSLFEEAGVPPHLVMYLVGPSMMKKTTVARLVGDTYNRCAEDSPHLINLLSTTAAVHTRVSALSDCCAIVDDLNASESRGEMRRREERLSEIIRTAGNGAGKEKMAGKNSVPQVPRGVVFVTAEYTLKAYSTMARCVVLHLDTPVENDRLTPLQQKPKALSTFWFYFLQWCCGQRDAVILFIQQGFARNRRSGRCVSGMERLEDAYFILEVALTILAAYMETIMPESAESIEKMQKYFKISLSKVQKRQIHKLQALRQNVDPERFSRMVADLYCTNQLNLRKKKHLGAGCIGAEGKRLLYLELSYLTREAQRYFRDGAITDRAITAELRENGLLEMDKSGRSTKKVNGVRYLHIRLDRLMEYRSGTNPNRDDELRRILHGFS